MIECPAPDAVATFLHALQDRLRAALLAVEGTDGGAFREDDWEGPGGSGRGCILEDGRVFERLGINRSRIHGAALPPAATAARPELAGRPFQAMGVSLVAHPRNPYVPASHLNVRFFSAGGPADAPVWWFGGGFDLTPCYGFDDDAIHWHCNARAACQPFGSALHDRCKRDCDAYFFLPHRNEARGIGGLFFDDFTDGGFAHAFAFMRSVAEHYLPGYLPLVARRHPMPYGERERDFQNYRRGRYVEFNLLQDRGTRFGLQSGGRAESILMSMPPVAVWRHDWRPAPGSPEAELYERFLVPRDWLDGSAARCQ